MKPKDKSCIISASSSKWLPTSLRTNSYLSKKDQFLSQLETNAAFLFHKLPPLAFVDSHLDIKDKRHAGSYSGDIIKPEVLQ